jgi:hypothetical protein
LCVFGCLNGRSERGPPSVVGDDAQHRIMPCGALAQCGQQARRERHQVKSAAVRPPLPHLAEQLLLELGAGRPPLPTHPRDQQRLARIGQQTSLGEIAKRPQSQPRGEQRRATADHHLAAIGIGDGQLPPGVGAEADLPSTGDEPPGLGVVHRGCPHRRRHHVPGDLILGQRLRARWFPLRQRHSVHGSSQRKEGVYRPCHQPTAGTPSKCRSEGPLLRDFRPARTAHGGPDGTRSMWRPEGPMIPEGVGRPGLPPALPDLWPPLA